MPRRASPLSSGSTATTGGPEAASVVPCHSVLVRAAEHHDEHGRTRDDDAPARATDTQTRRNRAASRAAVRCAAGDRGTPEARVPLGQVGNGTTSVGMSVRFADSDTSSRRICAIV